MRRGLVHRVGHRLLQSAVRAGSERFAAALSQPERVQRQQLAQLLSQVSDTAVGRQRGVRSYWNWEAFSRELPATDYADWRVDVELARAGERGRLTQSPISRFQPTSGSTSAIKWVPYSRRFLAELDAAISPWLADLYRRYSGLQQGSHYWSLSWVPTELRAQLRGDINDDSQLLSWGKRLLAGATQAVPDAVAQAPTSDDSLFATLAYLLADESLAMLSVWSPTFGLGLLEQLSHWREELVEVLADGHWGQRESALSALRCPQVPRRAALLRQWTGRPDADFVRALWPRLAVVSAWDTAAAAPWAAALREAFPQAEFQGKGLWATEGVVTIPYRDRYPLAVTSHVYEFEDAHSGAIVPPWQLDMGQEVMPLLSTGSGFLRYRMNDRLRVTGHLGRTPCFQFLGRNDGVDLVGEKMATVHVQAVLDALPYAPGFRPVTVLALDRGVGVAAKPGYVLLVDAVTDTPPAASAAEERSLAQALESRLSTHFHYQLAAAQCYCLPGMRAHYLALCRARGMIEGNIKIEPLRHWPTLPELV